jgi:hypothetical protein
MARRLHERAAGLSEAARAPGLNPREWLWKVQDAPMDAGGMPTPPGAGTWLLEPAPSAVPEPAGRESIEALRAWREERVRRRYQRREEQAKAEEAFKLSSQEIELWQKAQVALSNLRIQQAIGGPGAAQAKRQEQQIADNIERQMVEARAASERRLAGIVADLEAQMAKDLAAIRAEGVEKPGGPPPISRGVEELRTLRSNLDMQWWLPEPPAMKLSAETRKMSEALATAADQAVAAEQKQLAETAREQAGRLAEAAGRLVRLINDDTEMAVRSLALAHGVRMHITPAEAAAGKDMTAQCAEWLKEVWTQP